MKIKKLHNLPDSERKTLCESIILEAGRRSKGDEYNYLCEILNLIAPFISDDPDVVGEQHAK